MGLIALVQGCPNLEDLDVTLLDISNEAMEYVGTYLKNIRKFRMNLVNKSCITDLPLDNGIRALLIGCKKLERLDVSLCHGGLTDVGLGYIGKYGNNLRSLSLEYTGESHAGLVELSKGCPKLRKIRIMKCPFSEQAVGSYLFNNIHTLRYIGAWFSDYGLTFTRPMVPADAEVLPELNPYVTLAKKLRRLAVQLVADVGSVKIAYTSLRATDDVNTPLVDALVAKGIHVNEEQVLLHRASEKPLEILKVQIANVESRLAVAISESNEIKVEGRVKDGVPQLTKIGTLDVVVSLEEDIIICTQDLANISCSVPSILDGDNVIISSMSFSRIERTKQAVTVIGVNEKPSKKAFKKINEFPDVDQFVFLAL